MSNYTLTPNFYNTGFIPTNSDKLRIKQGLDPQSISSVCTYKDLSLENISETRQTLQEHNKRMYPVKQVVVDYGISAISSNNPCLNHMKY